MFTCTYAETPQSAGLAGNSEGMTSNQRLNVHVRELASGEERDLPC